MKQKRLKRKNKKKVWQNPKLEEQSLEIKSLADVGSGPVLCGEESCGWGKEAGTE